MAALRRLVACLTVLVLGALVPVALVPAGPAIAAAPQATLAEVLRSLRIDELPADYVVLLDVSSSMQQPGGPDLYARARAALRPLLEALSPVDRLHLVAFADRPDPEFSGRIGDAGAGVLDLLPDRAEGAKTDIGAAIESALDTVDLPDNTDPAMVVLLTDGKQDAPAGSTYAGNIGTAIERLRDRATGVERRRPVRALGLPLTGQTDVAMLDRVFDDTVLMDLPPAQVGDYLRRVGGRVAVEKAAARVSRDRLAVTLTPEQSPVTVSGEPVTVTARVRNEASDVPLEVTLTARVDGVPVPVEPLSGPAVLAPGKEETLRLRVSPPDSAGRWIGGERVRTGTLHLEASAGSPWRDVIVQDLGLEFAPAPATADIPVRATANGYPIWLAVLAGLVLVAVITLPFWLSHRRWRAMGGGRLTISEPGGAGPYRQLLSGRKVRFPAPHGTGTAPRGTGTVRAFRQRKSTGRGRELVLRIEYRRGGKKHKVICLPRQTKPLTDGTTFTYQP